MDSLDNWKSVSIKHVERPKKSRKKSSDGFIFKLLMHEPERSMSVIKSRRVKKGPGKKKNKDSQRYIPTPVPQTARNRKVSKIQKNRKSKGKPVQR